MLQMLKITTRVVIPLVTLCAICLFSVSRILDEYIIHPTGTLRQSIPAVDLRRDVTSEVLLPDQPVSRVCICRRELVLTKQNAKGIKKGDILTISDGKKQEKIKVKEIGDRTFFHRMGKAVYDEYLMPKDDRIPMVFIKTERDLALKPVAHITIDQRKE